MKLRNIAVGVTVAIASLGAFAQAASAPQTPGVDKREVRQDARIQQGVASGELTAKETYRIEKGQAAINKVEAKAKSDGQVTRAERRRLHKMQDHASRDIHRQKHDRQDASPKP